MPPAGFVSLNCFSKVLLPAPGPALIMTVLAAESVVRSKLGCILTPRVAMDDSWIPDVACPAPSCPRPEASRVGELERRWGRRCAPRGRGNRQADMPLSSCLPPCSAEETDKFRQIGQRVEGSPVEVGGWRVRRVGRGAGPARGGVQRAREIDPHGTSGGSIGFMRVSASGQRSLPR
ncbi:hypothetical protein D3C86_1016590 [compost metagenome]